MEASLETGGLPGEGGEDIVDSLDDRVGQKQRHRACAREGDAQMQLNRQEEGEQGYESAQYDLEQELLVNLQRGHAGGQKGHQVAGGEPEEKSDDALERYRYSARFRNVRRSGYLLRFLGVLGWHIGWHIGWHRAYYRTAVGCIRGRDSVKPPRKQVGAYAPQGVPL